MKQWLNYICEIINDIWELYETFDISWKQENHPLINFKDRKKRVDWFFDNKESIDFFTIITYWYFLKLNEDKVLEFQKNCKFKNLYRIKNLNSIDDKIVRYCTTRNEKGKITLDKCLNDIFGFRIIVPINRLLTLYNELEKNNTKTKFKKVKINLKNKEYKAIHIYFMNDKYFFPWELQIWLEKDIENNEYKHLIKYGN